jgi:hypothetical protein
MNIFVIMVPMMEILQQRLLFSCPARRRQQEIDDLFGPMKPERRSECI